MFTEAELTTIDARLEAMKAKLRMTTNRAAWAIATQSFHMMDAREFEEAIASLCRRDGSPDVHVTGKAGDFGANVVAITSDGLRCVIQAKRYSAGSLVAGPALQQFGGTCHAVHGADIAAVVTTSGFTKQAQEYAKAMRIVLFDNASLTVWAAQSGPSPWLALPTSLRPATTLGMEARGKHARR